MHVRFANELVSVLIQTPQDKWHGSSFKYGNNVSNLSLQRRQTYVSLRSDDKRSAMTPCDTSIRKRLT